MKVISLFSSLLFLVLSSTAQKKPVVLKDDQLKTQAAAEIQSHYEQYKGMALQIWNYAEVGYKEVKSSALLQKTLTENGFTVEAGVAGIPTAFVATYGSGKPVIAILAEFDAGDGCWAIRANRCGRGQWSNRGVPGHTRWLDHHVSEGRGIRHRGAGNRARISGRQLRQVRQPRFRPGQSTGTRRRGRDHG